MEFVDSVFSINVGIVPRTWCCYTSIQVTIWFCVKYECCNSTQHVLLLYFDPNHDLAEHNYSVFSMNVVIVPSMFCFYTSIRITMILCSVFGMNVGIVPSTWCLHHSNCYTSIRAAVWRLQSAPVVRIAFQKKNISIKNRAGIYNEVLFLFPRPRNP